MVFADTHTHLYLEEFDTDRDEVIDQCRQNGVQHLFCPNIDLQSIDAMREMCSRYPDCHPMMGLHPSEVKADYLRTTARILEEAEQGDYVGIGEIGMDLYWDRTFEEEQKKVLYEQLCFAQQKDLPAIIHCRKAFAETWSVLRQVKGPLKGIFHCFAGDVAQAHKIIERGFLIGVGGTVTYKRSGIQEVVRAIDLPYIVLETDSPFLPPVPHRGERNASYHIPIIAQQIADLKNVTLEEVAEQTTQNALKLFRCQ